MLQSGCFTVQTASVKSKTYLKPCKSNTYGAFFIWCGLLLWYQSALNYMRKNRMISGYSCFRLLWKSVYSNTELWEDWKTRKISRLHGRSMHVSEAPTSRPLQADSDTIPKLLLRNATRFADRPAFRLKDLGIWQTHTWSQVRNQVRDLAIGLHFWEVPQIPFLAGGQIGSESFEAFCIAFSHPCFATQLALTVALPVYLQCHFRQGD